jgi:hypothetical protein
VSRLGDHQRSTESPSEQNNRIGGSVAALAYVVDRGANILDLLLREKAAPFAVAEAEAAIIETEAGITVRDEGSCEAGWM